MATKILTVMVIDSEENLSWAQIAHAVEAGKQEMEKLVKVFTKQTLEGRVGEQLTDQDADWRSHSSVTLRKLELPRE